MKRKAVIAASGFFFGAFVSYHLGVPEMIIFMILLLVCIILAAFLPQPRRTACMFAAFCALLASAYSFCNFAFVISELEALDGQTVPIIGTVTDYTASDRSYVTVSGSVNGIECKLTTYINNFSGDFGDTVSFEGKVSALSDSPFFNTKSIYYAKGIYLRASVEGDLEITEGGATVTSMLREYSEKVANSIRTYVGGEAGDILSAMVCGDSSYIDDETSLTLSRSGIRHVIAVSGLHVSVVAAAVMFVLHKLRCPKVVSAVITESVVILFVIFAGGRVSCVRAAIMMSVYIISALSRRKADPLNTLSVAALVIMLFDPNVAADPSFCLSLAGTFGVSVASSSLGEMLGVKNGLTKLALACVCASFCTTPFLFLWFNDVSLISPITNMIFVPISSAALCLGFAFCVVGCTPAAAFLIKLAGNLVDITLYCCERISKLKFSYLPTGLVNQAALVTVMTVTFFAAMFFKRKPKALAVSLVTSMCLSICACTFSTLPDDTLMLDILCEDGNCVVLLRKNKECIIIEINGASELKDECDDVIQRYGITDVLAVAVNSRGESGYSAYSGMSVTPDIIYLPSDSYIFSGDVVFDVLPESLGVFGLDIRLRDGLAVFSQNGKSVAISVGGYYEVGTECNICVLDDLCVVSEQDTIIYEGDAFFSLEFTET